VLALGRNFRTGLPGLETGDSNKRVPSPDGLVEVATLGGRAQQSLVHGCGNAEVVIDNPATKLQLQPILDAVISDG
jgi:hypothetical protein